MEPKKPKAYWINSSGNDLVKRFIKMADIDTKDEIEQLIEGNYIEKKIRLDLTYDEIENSIDNLWSVLYTTGYLTHIGDIEDDVYKLVIPNKEIKIVFESKIQEWFSDKMKEDSTRLKSFFLSFTTGDTATIQEVINDYLWDSISIRDTAVRKDRKENFYHGLLLGLLQSNKGKCSVRSNEENGDGYSDITIRTTQGVGIVIELKYAEDGDLEDACKGALKQIKEKKYAEGMQKEDIEHVLTYGIAFYKKRCKVLKA